MSAESAAAAVVRPGLVWGFDFDDGAGRRIDEIDLIREPSPADGFRWLHFNLADQRTQRWIAATPALPLSVRDLLLSADTHQRAVVEDGVLGLVLQDIERDFQDGETRVGVARIAICQRMAITARRHPLRSGDLVRQRLAAGAGAVDGARALEVLLGAMAEVVGRTLAEFDDAVQTLEDDLLKDGDPPNTRDFIAMRSLMVRLHRLLSGGRAVFHRLEDDPQLAPPLRGVVRHAAGRLAALDAELLAVQSQLRLLREEADLQATQRTNQNLYVLSILTALLMPATLVTGLFGMNTEGLPWAHSPFGTLLATMLAAGSALAVYLGLRLGGFIRR